MQILARPARPSKGGFSEFFLANAPLRGQKYSCDTASRF
jgi:hypothetical protein